MCAITEWAATPLGSTWKLNREKSSLNGPLPSLIHNGQISFQQGGIGAPSLPPSHFIVVDGNGDHTCTAWTLPGAFPRHSPAHGRLHFLPVSLQ